MAIDLGGEYLALARKYRPQVFEDVVGQEHVLSCSFYRCWTHSPCLFTYWYSRYR